MIVRRPAQVHEVFVTQRAHLCKPEFLHASNRGHFGDGLTTLEGDAWRDRRSVVRAAFEPAAVARYLPAVRSQAAAFARALVAGQTLDLRVALRRLVARNAASMVLGAVADDDESSGGPRLPWSELYGEDFVARATDDGRVPLALRRPRAPAGMAATRALIAARDRPGAPADNVRTILLRSGMGREARQGELIQMLYAGHHTTPATLVALWRCLAAEPDVDAKVGGAAATPDDPSSFDFIKTVLRETLRRYPPAPLLYREVARPLALGESRLAPGTAVWACPHLLHHDPGAFEHPERFVPERWAGPHRLTRRRYIPFGAGPRICIAHRFALQQLTIIVQQVAARVRLVPIVGDRFGIERRNDAT